MAEINLVSNEWKHNLETTPTKSVNSLVSLYDLLFDEKGKLWFTYDDPSNAGTRLEHDIICFNKNILTASMAVDTTLAMSNSSWQTFGIDMSLPQYDARAKQKTVPFDNKFIVSSTSSTGEYYLFRNRQYTLYDKDSALPPATLAMFTNNGVLRLQTNLNADPSWENYTAPSVGIAGTNSSTAILLANEDTVFKSTLVTQDGFQAYNKIFLNPNSAYTTMLVARALDINLSIINMGSAVAYQDANNALTNTYINRIFGLLDDTVNNVWSLLNEKTTGLFEYILKNTFVWVRAPFYADYINTESFMQELNPDSKVVHSEIMLSGAGDFKKYDQYLLASKTKITEGTTDNRSEDTQPYIPQTSPTVDFYTSDFLKTKLSSIRKPTTDGNYSSKISESYQNLSSGHVIEDFLDEHVSGNDPVIKGLPIAAINRNDADTSGDGANLVPPNYFDPESRLTDKDYRKMGKFPTIIPVDGNIYADGRIISPTIDEIWYMLKKLISGRPSDITTVGDVTSYTNEKQAVNLDISIPYGSGDNYRNDTDTSMTEVPESEFNFSYEETSTNKYGDPIGFHYAKDKSTSISTINNDKIIIDKFVNQNNAIVYPVYKSLKSLSDRITIFDSTRTEDSKGDRYITNFTAWDSAGESTVLKEINGEDVSVQNVITDNKTVVSGIWAPRKVPYSIRELEALIMGNKFNIISFARFVKENFAVTGKLGKEIGPVGEDASNVAAGSLYQFHKNYNYEVDNPNTFYNMKGTNTGYDTLGNIVGAKAVIDDIDSRTPDEISRGVLRLHDEYATSPAINVNPEYYSSSDVYMAADGTWRYIGDHIRLPILRCDY